MQHKTQRNWREVSFLGTMAGDPVYVEDNLTQDKKPTYCRKYNRFGGSDELRETLFRIATHDLSGGENYKEMGEKYSFTPPSLDDGRNFGKVPSSRQGGGFFLTVKTFSHREECDQTSYAYVLNVMSDLLVTLSGCPIDAIQAKCRAYGMGYMIYKYFDSVQEPKEGNLVVYQTTESPGTITHAGIYRDSKENWNSPRGGTVESKLNYHSTHYASQHDMFYVPNSFGNLAKFFQPKAPKQKLLKSLSTLQPQIPNDIIRDNENWFFKKTPENQAIRDEISSISDLTLTSRFPEIKKQNHIQFTGMCYHYALGQVCKTYVTGSIPTCLEGNFKMIETYFTATTTPKKGDLVVYYRNGLKSIPVHYGIYRSENCVESKWGSEDVYRHPPFHVPNIYGDCMVPYQLKSGLTPESFIQALKQ